MTIPVLCSGGPASGRAQAAAQANTLPHCLTPLDLPRFGQRLPDFRGAARQVPMPLQLTGRAFREELERCWALALYAPLEGGAETRLLRRLRAAGYRTHLTSARGLGDPEAFLFQLHRVRPPPTWGIKAWAAARRWARCSG